MAGDDELKSINKDLLEALEEAADYIGEMGHPESTLEKARTAIAKAKVELASRRTTEPPRPKCPRCHTELEYVVVYQSERNTYTFYPNGSMEDREIIDCDIDRAVCPHCGGNVKRQWVFRETIDAGDIVKFLKGG
jgi:transposase